MLNRDLQLQNLETSLNHLITILLRDATCEWTRHFVRSLKAVQHYQAHGWIQAELNELSNSLMSVYGGMGSFRLSAVHV